MEYFKENEKTVKKPGIWDSLGTIFLFIVMVLPTLLARDGVAFLGSLFAWMLIIYIFIPSVRRYILQ